MLLFVLAGILLLLSLPSLCLRRSGFGCGKDSEHLLLYLLVLALQPLDDLDNQFVLMLQVRQDMANLLFAFGVSKVIILGGQPILGGLSVLTHHNEWGRVGSLE